MSEQLDEPKKSAESIWQSVVDAMSLLCNRDDVNALHTLVLENKEGRWTLFAPSKFVLDRVKASLLPTIEMALKKRGIKKVTLSLDMPDLFTPPTEKHKEKQSFESNLNPDFQFHNFVAGPSNNEALAAAQRVANGFHDANPLVIYGGTGLGKSHLLHAIGNALRANHGTHVLYINAQDFVSEYISSLSGKTTSAFSRRMRSVEALIIDDVQFLGGKNQSQIEFFQTFNELFGSKRQIIMASDRFPREIVGLEDRLKSRFGAGLNVSVHFPELETRTAILQNKARQMDFHLPLDVGIYIAQHIVSNVRELEGALRKLMFVCDDVKNGAIPTINIAKRALTDMLNAQNKQLTIENIQQVVAKFYELKPADILSKSRKANIVRARQVAMRLTRELTKHSLPEIGQAFERDHSTIIHACQKIEKDMKKKEALENEYLQIRDLLTA